MAVPTPHTWTAAEVATAANLQSLTAAINFLLSGCPHAYAYASTATTLPSGTTTAIAFDNEAADSEGLHVISGATDTRLTCVTAGTYLIIGQVAFGTNSSTGGRGLFLRKNGTQFAAASSAASPATHTENCSSEVTLAVGDYVEAFAFQSSGSSMNTQTGVGTTFLSGRWLGTS